VGAGMGLAGVFQGGLEMDGGGVRSAPAAILAAFAAAGLVVLHRYTAAPIDSTPHLFAIAALLALGLRQAVLCESGAVAIGASMAFGVAVGLVEPPSNLSLAVSVGAPAALALFARRAWYEEARRLFASAATMPAV